MATPYADALAIAQNVEALLAPSCARTLIAGSIRRQKPTVKDIELVVIPSYVEARDMFEEVVGQQSRLDARLAELGIGAFAKNGERYKQFTWQGIAVDLFIQIDPATWGVNATLRTGSAEFSAWLVTSRRKGGALPAGWKVADGRLWNETQILDTPEERDVFTALGVDWLDPTERTAETTATLWRR